MKSNGPSQSSTIASFEISSQDRELSRKKRFNRNAKSVSFSLLEHQTQDPISFCPKKFQSISENENVVCDLLDLGIEYKLKHSVTGNVYSDSHAEKFKELVDNHELNDWLHIDQLELDKLKWMSTKPKCDESSKFDSEGRIVIKDTKNYSEIGDDGHDLETLIKDLDSSYTQKASYALNVISKIAEWTSCSYYDNLFEQNIHQILVEKCLLRARHLLDISNETTLNTALKCIRSIICNCKIDELLIDRAFTILRQPDVNLWLFPKNEYGVQTRKNFEEDYEMKDMECVKIDPILTLIDRTHILERFAYLMNASKSVCSEIILDVLIRFARHSVGVCQKLASNKILMEVIIEKFITIPYLSEGSDFRLTFKSLKLIRIILYAASLIFELKQQNPLSSAVVRAQSYESRIKPIQDLLPTPVLKLIKPYLAMNLNMDDNNSLKLHMEAMRCIIIMLDIDQLRPKCIEILDLLSDQIIARCTTLKLMDPTKPCGKMKTSIDWQCASLLINMTCLYQKEKSSKYLWELYIQPAIHDWFTKIINTNTVPHTDVSITLDTSIQWYFVMEGENTVSSLEKVIVSQLTRNMERHGDYGLIRKLVQECGQKSQLQSLLDTCGNIRDPKVLPSFGCVQFNKSPKYELKVTPYLDDDTPFILYSTFIRIFCLKENNFESSHFLLENDSAFDYLKNIHNLRGQNLNYESMVHKSLFVQMEVQNLGKLLLYLKKVITLRTNLDVNKLPEIKNHQCKYLPSYQDLYFDSVIVLSILSSRSRYGTEIRKKLLNQLIFDKNLHFKLHHEAFLAERWQGYKNNRKTESLIEFLLGETGLAYQSIRNDFVPLLEVVYSCDKPVNRFWLFKPLVDYYGSQIKKKENMNRIEDWFRKRAEICGCLLVSQVSVLKDIDILSTILSMLTTVIVNCTLFSHYIVKPNVEECLAAVGCLFLDDKLFLEERISNSLRITIRTIIRNSLIEDKNTFFTPFKDGSKYLVIMKQSVIDFFNELVDHFESVSYGDVTFTNFLLLFLANGSDKQFRKKLFQEKAETCLSNMRMPGTDVWAPSEIFFSTKEDDQEIKLLMKMSMPYLKQGSFIHHYAYFHSN